MAVDIFTEKALVSIIDSPTIGVLCIDVAQKLSKIYGTRIKSYIAASYVKYLEGAEARVVPIWIGKKRSYYEQIMSKINGLLIPGGAVFFNAAYTSDSQMSNDCVQSSKFIFEIAAAKNAVNDYFPLWGTCLGYELLLFHSAKDVDLRQDCAHMDCALPVEFEKDFRNSSLFGNFSSHLEQLMQTAPFGYHYHRYCITKNDLLEYGIEPQWRILATNKDSDGLEFISIVEHKDYPFYGCQFHPERVRYEMFGQEDVSKHLPDCIEATQYLAEFFVAACRRCNNRFPTHSEMMRHWIGNFTPVPCGQHGARWNECYIFDQQSDYPKTA